MKYSHNFFENEAQARHFRALVGEMLLVFAFLAILVLSAAQWLGFRQASAQYLACNADALDFKMGLVAFVGHGARFSGGEMQSDQIARSGKYSLKLTEEHPYGFGYEVEHLRGNEHFSISAWRHGRGQGAEPGRIVASVDGYFWQATKAAVEVDDNGWEKITFEFSPPISCKNKLLKIFCWNSGDWPIYFDDLEIRTEWREKL